MTETIPTAAPSAASAPFGAAGTPGAASASSGAAGTDGAASASRGAARPAVDRCPGILRLHDAGDGGLARVRVPGGRLDAQMLAALAEGAALGNGLAELTSRASVQLRGLGEDAAAPLARVLAAGGLLPSRAHDRVRNVLASPVAGRVGSALLPTDALPRADLAAPAAAAPAHGSLLPTDALVAALDTALCADPALAALPGRFLFAIDDGARLVDTGVSDVALVAEHADPSDATVGAHAGLVDPGVSDAALVAEHADPSDANVGAGAHFRVFLAGTPTALTVAPADAVELLLRAAHAFLVLRAEFAPTAWHVADLPDGARGLATALGTEPAAPMPGRLKTSKRPRIVPGQLTQRDGRVAITALPPLARLDRAQLAGLAGLLDAEGLADLRLSPSRTITLVDVAPQRAHAVADALAAFGLVVAPGSGWHGLTACSGTGACRRALVDVRAAASVRAARRGADAPAEHWSACERRCGMKRDVPVGVVAGGATTLAVTRAGATREAADVQHALELLDATRDEGSTA
jgi:sulfite reductase beta subunit-like hemoprotein